MAVSSKTNSSLCIGPWVRTFLDIKKEEVEGMAPFSLINTTNKNEA